MALTVTKPDRGEFALSITVSQTQHRDNDTARKITGHIRKAAPVGTVQLWIEHASNTADQFAHTLGFSAYRDLWCMQIPLPVEHVGLPTRAFVPERDEAAFLEVNNRAFAWHPEQSNMTTQELAKRMREDWFDPHGFLLYEQNSHIAGFCWTKVHSQKTPPAGEIYAIAVDPNYHGQGLGQPLTAAGLHHLHQSGLTIGFLYVESDNKAAITTYQNLGFTHHSTNRAYRKTL